MMLVGKAGLTQYLNEPSATLMVRIRTSIVCYCCGQVRELTRGMEEHAGSKEGLQELLSQQLEEAEKLKVGTAQLAHDRILLFIRVLVGRLCCMHLLA